MRGLFGGRWSGPQFILTHTPPTDETDPSYTLRSGDVRDAVSTAQTSSISASRPDLWMRSLCTSCRS